MNSIRQGAIYLIANYDYHFDKFQASFINEQQLSPEDERAGRFKRWCTSTKSRKKTHLRKHGKNKKQSNRNHNNRNVNREEEKAETENGTNGKEDGQEEQTDQTIELRSMLYVNTKHELKRKVIQYIKGKDVIFDPSKGDLKQNYVYYWRKLTKEFIENKCGDSLFKDVNDLEQWFKKCMRNKIIRWNNMQKEQNQLQTNDDNNNRNHNNNTNHNNNRNHNNSRNENVSILDFADDGKDEESAQLSKEDDSEDISMKLMEVAVQKTEKLKSLLYKHSNVPQVRQLINFARSKKVEFQESRGTLLQNYTFYWKEWRTQYIEEAEMNEGELKEFKELCNAHIYEIFYEELNKIKRQNIERHQRRNARDRNAERERDREDDLHHRRMDDYSERQKQRERER